MADTMKYDWGEVDVENEEVTKESQDAAESMTTGTPVGTFLCTVVESAAIHNEMKNYTCVAADLKMRIDNVVKAEQVVLDGNGEPIILNEEPQKKVMVVMPDKQAAFNKLYSGKFITDIVNLFHKKEKDGMRNRRILIARRFGLIKQENETLTPGHWGKLILGKQAIVTTEIQTWDLKDSNGNKTGEKGKMVRVAFTGYDYPAKSKNEESTDFAGQI